MADPVTTHEHEITYDVDLCRADGVHLNGAARGWSRVPHHRANLHGRWGRTKRWDYWGILAGDVALAVTYADVDYLGIADVWWCYLPTGQSGGRNLGVPLALGFDLPEWFGTTPLRYTSKRFAVEILDDDAGTHLNALWHERDGTPAWLAATVELPAGHESLNVVIPWSESTFQYTSKHQARPAHGELVVGDRHVRFGRPGDEEPEAWGVLDVGRGRWPYRTNWNWGGGAGPTTDGAHTIGLQLGAKWTVGTGFTENGVIVDGRLTKIGDELDWSYDWHDPLKPWTVHGGGLDLRLEPRFDKHTRVEAGVMGMEVHQVFGQWSGTCTDADGASYSFSGLQGFAEESRNRW